MGYLKVSKELLNGSFWRSLADKEKVVLIELMNMTAYKPVSVNLAGVDVPVQMNELCIFASSLSKYLNISIYCFRSLLKKMCVANVCCTEIRKMGLKDSKSKPNSKLNDRKIQHYTSISFYPWVFAQEPENETKQMIQSANQVTNQTHNKESINKEAKRNSACAVSSSQRSQSSGYRKPWYTMERIADMDLPNAKDILAEWCLFSGKCEKDILALLERFARKQKLFGLPEMTLDVFDREFRKEMKRAFDLKSNHKNEPVRELKLLGEDD